MRGPGELLLDVIAARILATAALFSQNNPGQPAAADARLTRPRPANPPTRSAPQLNTFTTASLRVRGTVAL